MINTMHLKWSFKDDRQLELLISQQCGNTEGNTCYYYLDDRYQK